MASGVSGYFDLTGTHGITARVHYTETYDVSTNKSTVTISQIQIMSSWYYGYTYYLDGTVSVADSVAVSMNSGSGTHSVRPPALDTFASVNGSLGAVSDIAHNDDGSKSVTITVSIKGYSVDGGGSGWSVSGSHSVLLTTIPRKSTISAEDGTLGVAQVLTVTRQASSFTHTVKYRCGNAGGTIASETSETSISWTPPPDLARQNISGTTVAVELIVETFSMGVSVGSNSITISCAIPFAPSVSAVLSDPTGYKNVFGGYVQNRSTLKVDMTAAGRYGAEIQSAVITCGDKSASGTSATFDLPSSGPIQITVMVVDSRGRSAVSVLSTTVLKYSNPAVTAISAYRCGADGTADKTGAYMNVIFSANITALANRNTAAYTVRYRTVGASYWSTVTPIASGYSPSNVSTVIEAATGSSYEVQVEAEDYFTSAESAIRRVLSAYALVHLDKAKNRIGIGKVAEVDNALDMGWNIQMNQKTIKEAGGISIAAYSSGEETGDISFSRPTNYEYEAHIDVLGNALRIYRYDTSNTYKQVLALGLTEGILYTPYVRPSNPVGIAYGGTGATTAAAALKNLGAFPAAGGTATGNITIEKADPYLYLKNSDGGGDNLGLHYYGTASGSNRFAIYDVKNAKHLFEVYQSDGSGWFRGNLSVGGSVLKVGGQQQIYWNDSAKSQTIGTNNATGGTIIACGPSANMTLRGAAVIPGNSGTLGNSSNRWTGIYSTAAVNVSSDERLKRDITELDGDALANFVGRLKVVSYKYKDDAEERKARIGLVAQEVQQADADLAKFFVEEDAEGMLSLSPADLVFPLIASVQKLTERVSMLEDALRKNGIEV